MTVLYRLSDSEDEAIEELKSRLIKEMTPEMHQDKNMFYRFLKARDFNIDHAEIMLINHLKWRKEFKVDEIRKSFTPAPVMVKYFPGCHIGLDKEGCPVKYYPFGNLNGRGVRKSIKFIDIVRNIIWSVEKEVTILEEESEKRGKRMPGTVAILDMKNLSFSEATDRKSGEHAIYLLKMYQDNYPERLKSVHIINTSMYFQMAFRVIKAFLASTILKKIHICASDQQQSELLKEIDADVLPMFLGGNRTDSNGDPKCRSFVEFCGKVPEEYFMTKQTGVQTLAMEPEARRLVVSRLAESEVAVEVDQVGSVIEWEFETKGSRDIGFGILLRRKQQKKEVVIVPQLRIDMDECVETGAYVCEETGTYVLVFNNTYSWFRTKEVYYRVKVIRTEELEENNLF